MGLSVAIGMSSRYGLFRPSFYRSQPVEQDLHHSRYSHGRRSESRPRTLQRTKHRLDVDSPSLPLPMVTMDTKQGFELVKLICPNLTIPIHYE